MGQSQAALFLDRDGVIIENRANYVRSWADVDIFPQALRALQTLRDTPYVILIVTNQSAIGRGIMSRSDADRINNRLVSAIEQAGGRVDGVYVCPHAPEENCTCRKPAPGLLLQAAREREVDLANSILIGDAVTDLEAGRRAGVGRLIFVRSGRGQEQEALLDKGDWINIAKHDDLEEAISNLGPKP